MKINQSIRFTLVYRVFLLFLVVSIMISTKVVNAQTQLQFFRFGGTMDLSPVPTDAVLTTDGIRAWEEATEDFYLDALTNRLDVDPPISDVSVTIVLQFAARPGDAATNLVLALEYQATVSFSSDSTDYDPAVLALPAFRDETNVFNYVNGLIDSGNSIFQQVTSLSLTVRSSVAISPPPTENLTSEPTDNPTTEPTSEPTDNPTSEPSLMPVLAPTLLPTDRPVLEVTNNPTRMPSFSLTAKPSPAPSEFIQEPTDIGEGSSDVVVTKYVTTELQLEDTSSTLEGATLQAWTTVTSSYLNDYVLSVDGNLNPNVEITSVLQSLGSVRQRNLRARRTQDQEDSFAPLLIEFVSKLELPQQYDATSLVNGAFATRNRRDNYRNLLLEAFQASEDGILFSVNFVQVILITEETDENPQTPSPNDQNPPPSFDSAQDGDNEEPEDPSKGGKGSSAGLIGGIVGGVVVLGLIGIIIFRSYRKGENDSMEGSSRGSKEKAGTKRLSPTSSHGNEPEQTAAGLTWEPAEQPSRLNQEIVVESMDDVSTIGDPLYGNQGSSTDADDKTATTSVMMTDTYNSLLGRSRDHSTPYDSNSISESKGDTTEFSAFTGMSKYLQPNSGKGIAAELTRGGGLLGELAGDETSFEQRLFPMDKEEEDEEDRSLDFSYPTALMDDPK